MLFADIGRLLNQSTLIHTPQLSHRRRVRWQSLLDSTEKGALRFRISRFLPNRAGARVRPLLPLCNPRLRDLGELRHTVPGGASISIRGIFDLRRALLSRTPGYYAAVLWATHFAS